MNNEALIDMSTLTVLPGERGYLNQIGKIGLLSREDELALAREFRKTGDKQAAWQLVCHHLRLVVKIARGYSGYGLPEADLIQEGNVGLMVAVKKFDPEVGVRLSTYATHWIKASIGEFIIRNWKMMRIASTTAQRKLFYRLRGIAGKLGRRLTDKDARQVADELEVKSTDVLEMERRMFLPEVPFEDNSKADDELDTSPSSFLAADDGSHAELEVDERGRSQLEHEALAEAIASLPERERVIMQERALTDSGKDTKLRELADRFDISNERVRQLEKQAMQSVREHVLRKCAHLRTA